MLEDRLRSAALTLVQGRGRALGAQLTSVARRHGQATAPDLMASLKDCSKEDKPAIGLLLSRVILEDASASGSRSRLSDFLFRFGAHLKTSASASRLAPSQRFVLAVAADETFRVMPTATRAQKLETGEIRARLAKGLTPPADEDWIASLGMRASEFRDNLYSLAEPPSSTSGSPSRHASELHSGWATVSPKPEGSRRTVKHHPLPTWLSIEFSGEADPLVTATANWNPAAFTGETTQDIQSAWNCFSEGDHRAARAELSGLYASLGSHWGPRTTADGLRSWHWLRLVAELAAIEAGEVADQRRAATSAFELAWRCLPDADDLLESLLDAAISDFAASDLATRRAWCAYTARVTRCADHERALRTYTNEEKAALRRAWADQFKLQEEEVRNTATMANTVRPRLSEACQRLYVEARADTPVARTLRAARRAFPPFLDEAESELFEEAVDLLLDIWRSMGAESALNHREISEHTSALRDMGTSLANSGSLLLQDYVAPHLSRLDQALQASAERLGDISRPEVSIRLEAARLPFSATPGTSYPLRLVASNLGNATAEDITVRVRESDLELDETCRLEALGAGAEGFMELWARATGKAPQATTLMCEATWSDTLAQSFAASFRLAAEDQQPASWTPLDVNPFSLGTISDPSRLVGRDEDLAALEALLAGGGSAYVTGHKRVGKTSLTRVLLSRGSEQRGWAVGMMSLGRALGPDQSAGELVYALMDEILEAVQSAYPTETALLTPLEETPGVNFARAADRWLRAVSRVLPATAPVVIAIDDFDELPTPLVNGPQADALFLFLRSLVDESWLNLIVVGSEVLPTIIESQAHKLNQVVPVSVSNFANRAATEALLVSPTEDRLDWQGEAIDRVHYLCKGNPYYETLLAQHLWPSMRKMQRSFVTVSDVDASAAEVAKTAPSSHFVHLWADSSTGLNHTSRRAVVTSAILRAVARSGGAENAAASSDEVVSLAQTWIQTATAEELQQLIGGLVRRGVLEWGPSEGSLLMSIPLVSIWLTHAGSRALDEQYSASTHATAAALLVTVSDLTALSKGLRYRGEHISEIRIQAWLNQFGDNYHQYLAFQMLKRMVGDGYFTPTRLHDKLLPKMVEQIQSGPLARHITRDTNQYLKNAYLLDHGVPGDSTQGTISSLRTKLKVKKAQVLPVDDLVDRMKIGDAGVVIFVLDDFVGSGHHIGTVVDGLLERLPQLGPDWHERVHVLVGGIVVADPARLPRPEGPVSVEHAYGMALGNRFHAFSSDSGVFDTAQQRTDSKDLVSTIGRGLVPKNPLGFGDDALLALLEFNCPNNAPPVFWKRGTWGNRPWEPLFERSV